MSTCQICGRTIKANTGFIAHHGYTRPGSGWQTASCMGARHLPYEVSCDVLPKAIESLTCYVENAEADLVDWIANPPDVIKVKARGSWHSYENQYVEHVRPDGFVYDAKAYAYFDDYIHHHLVKVHEYNRDIKASKETLEYLKNRLENWVKVEVE